MVRAALDAFLSVLHKVAAPTGARGSVLLMTGGLIVLGFLFLAFLFRSAIVGDLAPVANARAPTPRALLPGQAAARRSVSIRGFEDARQRGREAPAALDPAMRHLATLGVEARILQSAAGWKLVRLYACGTCAAGGGHGPGCEVERGLLAGAFETLGGDLAKVQEVACARHGAAHCEFTVHHAPLRGAPA